jgi:hypothetical protein
MSNLIIETNNNFIKDFNILQNKSGNQIEGKYSDFSILVTNSLVM